MDQPPYDQDRDKGGRLEAFRRSAAMRIAGLIGSALRPALVSIDQATRRHREPTQAVEIYRGDKQETKFDFVLDKNLIRAANDYAGVLGMPNSDFMTAAFEYEMLKQGTRKADARITAERPYELGQDSRASLFDLNRDYGDTFRHDIGKAGTFPVTMDQEQMTTIMLGAAHLYREDTDVKTSMQTWGEQAHFINKFGATALRNFMIRLEAEADGWELKVDNNEGSDRMWELEDYWSQVE